MSLKHLILETLESRRGEFFSGQRLAEQFGVTRAAIGKAVKTLEADGNLIKAVPNRGYCIANQSDALTREGIRARLKPEYAEIPIETIRVTDSTNNELKRRTGLLPDYVLLAEEQSGGRGRRGKSFFSPPFTSIYVSFLLEPKRLSIPISFVTTAAAVAVSRAVKKETGAETTIKWVNDLFLGDKKVTGILTEAVASMESGEIERVVLGIGLNCHWRGVEVPKEIAAVAAALETEVPRNAIAAGIVNEVFDIMYCGSRAEILAYVRDNSYLLGKAVRFDRGEASFAGVAEEIDDEGRLIVRLENGEREILSAGEVSVRKAEA